MLWKIDLTPSALKDLKRIEEYYEQIDVDYARALIKKLFARFETLSQLPHRGSKPKLNQLRGYLQVLEKPYRILYRIEKSAQIVYVVAVIHHSQDFLQVWRSSPR